MKKILIIYPHFPPSNLAGVHRARLFAQHLPSFDWEPTILTVHEKYYEEELDLNLEKLLPKKLIVEKVSAYKVTKNRLVGDIGLRAFFQLYKKAKELIRLNKYDFLYIPIPSFYCALLGRMLNFSTNIKYGIDYIDPWVHVFPGSNKKFSRHWFSTKLAMFLEPIAVKKAVLITGVASGYYEPVLVRNPYLNSQAIFGAMPYGGEKTDHEILNTLNIKPYLFNKSEGVTKLMYAGAMLPKAYEPLEAIFNSISKNETKYNNIQFHFVGTGSNTNDASSYSIKPLAEKYGLYNEIVFEHPARIPYLDVLVHLNVADAVFILGSTEPHYTPSKTYQAILSQKPIIAVLHSMSSAVKVIRESNAGLVLDFNGSEEIDIIQSQFSDYFLKFLTFKNNYNSAHVNQLLFNEYSANAVTQKLVLFLNQAIQKNN